MSVDNRNLIISGEINSDCVKEIVNNIIDINCLDDEKEKTMKSYERKPINLFINSNGGFCYDGYAICDIIEASRTPVHTISLGFSASMALVIFESGHKRLVGKKSTLMIHGMAHSPSGKIPYIIQEVGESKRLEDIMVEMLLAKNEHIKTKLSGTIDRKEEWYITPEEAVTLKLADGYYD